jgi:hypothetical protein
LTTVAADGHIILLVYEGHQAWLLRANNSNNDNNNKAAKKA